MGAGELGHAPSAHATARRNLAQRIERFLRAQIPSDWQADQVMVAIEMLDAERFSDGERVMMYVEKPKVWAPVEYSSVERRDARELLEQLHKMLA